VEDDLHAPGLGGGDQLAEEVPPGGAGSGDLGGPGTGVAEAAVEGGEDQVLGVQLLCLVHPVVRRPAAARDVVLPGGAAGVGRCGAQAPVQEESADGSAEEVLTGVLQVERLRRRTTAVLASRDTQGAARG